MFGSLFSRRGLSLERLRVLIEVHDAGSIAQAAAGDATRQSQYSRQLRELSEFFGCEVIRRRGKVLKLTAEGNRLVDIVRIFLLELEDFNQACKGERAQFTIAAGDSLVHWLVIPRLGSMLKRMQDVRFTTLNLRTDEIVQQITEARIDFGLIRRDALPPGMKYASLGTLSYVAVIPKVLFSNKRMPEFAEMFTKLPLAMQVTDGQFSRLLNRIASAEVKSFRPAISCQSFPQTLAAVRSGQFAAIIPELAANELPSGSIHKIAAPELKRLQRDIVLVWNPRVIKVRPHAAKISQKLHALLRFS